MPKPPNIHDLPKESPDDHPNNPRPDTQPPDHPTTLMSGLSSDSFNQWWTEREFAQNILDGKHYFNGPSPIPEPEKHNPSQLLKCSRKIYYKQENAPAETQDPRGIFWLGSRFEEDVIVPFLTDEVATDDQYVTNSLWIDFTTSTPAGEIRIKGATDPVIVTAENEPVVLTEIKTKQDTEDLRSPDRQHLAQAHAYMAGLSDLYETEITDAIIIYASRTTFDLTPIRVQFNEQFWENSILGWASQHTQDRHNGDLPAANPEHDWECGYCDYKERCGKGDREFSDQRASGLLPLFEYPRKKVKTYLEAHENAKLTPSLAHQFPNLTREYSVYDWVCRGCNSRFDWDSISQPVRGSAPRCPMCDANGRTRLLSGPQPADQLKGPEEESHDD